jgi:hypothetical protein
MDYVTRWTIIFVAALLLGLLGLGAGVLEKRQKRRSQK